MQDGDQDAPARPEHLRVVASHFPTESFEGRALHRWLVAPLRIRSDSSAKISFSRRF